MYYNIYIYMYVVYSNHVFTSPALGRRGKTWLE